MPHQPLVTALDGTAVSADTIRTWSAAPALLPTSVEGPPMGQLPESSLRYVPEPEDEDVNEDAELTADL
jgi:hypothetical protein